MSSVVKTITPFIDREILCQVLEKVGCKCRVQGEKIITDRSDVRLGFQEFTKDSYGKYALYAYSYTDKNQATFIKSVENHYNDLYKKKIAELERLRLEAIAETERKRLEEERLRLERERQEFVEKQRTSIIAKAKERGYSVREEKVKNKIKLVLVRNTY
jgi:hypothetical protein